jgi:hypothetical protein
MTIVNVHSSDPGFHALCADIYHMIIKTESVTITVVYIFN